jgi:metacaspase-1
MFEPAALYSHPPGRGAVSKRALLVGINDYPHQPLRGCINDVQDVFEFLQVDRGFVASEIRTLRDGQATRAAILHELRALAAVSVRGDTLVFYFCGHGAQLPTRDPNEPDGLDEVLCPVDFDWTPDSSIVDNELEHIFDAIADGVDTTWAFDACHSGDIDEALDARAAACRAMTPPRANAAPSLAPVPTTQLCRLLSRDRGVFLTACGSTEKAADIVVDGQPRGAFTYYLLQAARALPQATAAEILLSVRDALSSIGQRPEGYGPGVSSPFINRIVESNVNAKEHTRTVMIAANPSVDADRHLHAYLAEASRLAFSDGEFGARMSDLGVDLSGISSSDALALARAVKPAQRSDGTTYRTFWWGFHLEIPQAELHLLDGAGINHLAVARMIESVPQPMPHRVAPHLGTLVEFVVTNFDSIKGIDRGAGVFISMSSFAPDLYVATAVPLRANVVRRGERDLAESCAIRM